MTTKMRDGISLGDLFVEFGLQWFENEYPEGLKLRSRTSVFNGAITMWMMIAQKGIADNSLVSAVQQLKSKSSMDKVAKILEGSKKYVFDGISNNGGGFSQARMRLPIEQVEAFADNMARRSEREHRAAAMLYGYNSFVLDGSTIGLESDERIIEEFPRQNNQHGANQPAARVVVAHNVITGIALRPEIGNIKDSEQGLSHKMISRMPNKSLLIGDRNFGVFSVAWHAKKAGVVPLVRLQKQRAKKILGKKSILRDSDSLVTWHASRHDHDGNDFPEDAHINGRVVAITLTVPGRRSERFYFFTTALDLTPEEILDIYKSRWLIETDLRSIKATVNLDMVHAKTPDVAKKEIILGVVAYSMLRTVIARGAKMIGLKPRQISFSRAREFILTTAIRLGQSTSVRDLQITLGTFLTGLRQLKHPNRTAHRTEPRVIATVRRRKFPGLKGTRKQARQKLISRNMSKG